MVSGELQGGAVVEPRGIPKTYGELWTYIRSAIHLLRVRATDDADAEIRGAATKALVDAIHPMLKNPNVREELFDALAALPDDSRRRVWTAIKHLQALFDRVETPEFAAATNTSHDTAARRAGLNVLVARLPEPGAADELQVLAAAQRWEWEDGELERKIVDVAQSLPAAEATRLMLRLLSSHPPAEASFELGVALHAVAADVSTLASLVDLAQSGNLAGLVGYLYGSVRAGDEDAFDSFLDGELSQQLDDTTRLAITVRGPKSAAGWTRALDLMSGLPVHVAAPRLFGWHVDVEEDRIAALLADWLPRIETQQDYNAAVDVTAMMVFRRPPPLGHDIERLIAGSSFVPVGVR
ncbi:MAG: hypothetical protein M3P70_07615 [Actinomycetota bacterium]|nr:hypothetical protein [Actinomycetota bacterium]